ncbi:MAG: ABC transporter ATP-binding protein [Planctomycetes bacterium]|nr:ABC transporter ATP-binding protein [Planctomycetota bacterium]
MSEPAVVFDHVWKRFSKGRRARTLAELVYRLPRRLLERADAGGLRDGEFWALKDVSFEVEKGEMLGIVGANGAGKSTVLKLLFRILRPERGQVTTRGRVGGLIELGAGFHPYLTGRENVFINGAILGMRMAEIRRKYDSIVEFAGIPEFMDMPVKDYSSGMFARLAFAVAAHAEPDVLLVDEVLAVGDTAFQLKCYDAMARKRKQGTTVLLVSHNMYALAAASRVMYLRSGDSRACGEPKATIAQYLDELERPHEQHPMEVEGGTSERITGVELLDAHGQPVRGLLPGEALHVRFHYALARPVESPIFAMTLLYNDTRYSLRQPTGQYLVHLNSGTAFSGRVFRGVGCVEVTAPAVHAPVGLYRAKSYLFERDGLSPLHVRDGVGELEILRPEWSDQQALVDLRQYWRVAEAVENTKGSVQP